MIAVICFQHLRRHAILQSNRHAILPPGNTLHPKKVLYPIGTLRSRQLQDYNPTSFPGSLFSASGRQRRESLGTRLMTNQLRPQSPRSLWFAYNTIRIQRLLNKIGVFFVLLVFPGFQYLDLERPYYIRETRRTILLISASLRNDWERG